MKIVRRLLPAGIALIAGVSLAQAPLELKGVRIGSASAAAATAFPGFNCDSESCLLVPSLFADQECRASSDRIACKEYFEGELQFGPARAELYLGDVVNGRIGRMMVVFHQVWFADVAGAMRKKYGVPSSSATQTAQNSFGASFANRVLIWRRTDGELRLEERPESVDKSRATLTAPWFDGAKRSQTDKKETEAAKKL